LKIQEIVVMIAQWVTYPNPRCRSFQTV